MRCERCGVELTNKLIKINAVPYCENCARIMGYGKFLRSPEEMLGSAFSPFDEIASSIMQMNELDFGNSALSCPKCGMSLREFERKGRLGCIECYNTFNDYIVKEMFKQQGESTYGGRMPGQTAELNNIEKGAKPESKIEANSESPEEKAPEKEEAKVLGEGENFTTFTIVTTTSTSDASWSKMATICSGTKVADGIKNFYRGILLLDKYDPNNNIMAVGDFRIFKDGDGMSEYDQWLARQKNSGAVSTDLPLDTDAIK